MKSLSRYWHSSVLLLVALLINEHVVHWALAVKVGGYSVAAGFTDAFKYFSVGGYLFCTAFRLIPYMGLAITLLVLSKTKAKDFVLPVWIGGLIGILGTILWGLWMTQRPYYTDEHVSSTTAIAFLFIPLYACFTGGLGGLALAVLYLPFWFVAKRKKAEPQS